MHRKRLLYSAVSLLPIRSPSCIVYRNGARKPFDDRMEKAATRKLADISPRASSSSRKISEKLSVWFPISFFIIFPRSLSPDPTNFQTPDRARYSRNLLISRLLLLRFFSPPRDPWISLVRGLSLPETPFSFSRLLYRGGFSLLLSILPSPPLPSFPSLRRSFRKPASRKRPTTLPSRHCLSEQTAWSCLGAK